MTHRPVQIIGLDEVKAELGDDWPDLATKVRALAKGLVRERLRPGRRVPHPGQRQLRAVLLLAVQDQDTKAEVIRERLTSASSAAAAASISQASDKPFDLRRLTAMH